MGWISGPVLQDIGTTMTWWMFGFGHDPSGVVVTAEPIDDGDEVISTNSGSHQPDWKEVQVNNNPYKSYRVDVQNVRTDRQASFWLRGIGP